MSLKTGQTTLPQMIDEINRVAGKADAALKPDAIAQTIGQNADKVMSQKAVTDALADVVGGGIGDNISFEKEDPVSGYIFTNKVNGAGIEVSAEGVDYRAKYSFSEMALVSNVALGLYNRVALRAQTSDGNTSGYYNITLPAKSGIVALKEEVPSVMQATGTSTTAVMSQKAVTDALDEKVNTADIVNVTGQSIEKVMSQAAVTNALVGYLPKDGPNLVVGQTGPLLTNGKSYLDCTLLATVSSGTYYFYNCSGAVTVSGNNAKVYAANCPNLTINGKTASNWQNIWIDGVATNIFGETSNGFIIRYLDGTMYQSGIGTVLGSAPSKGLFSLPASFYNTNYTVIITSMPNYTDEDYGWYRVIFAAQAYSKTQFGVMKISPTGGEQSIPWFTYLAIGRWKA